MKTIFVRCIKAISVSLCLCGFLFSSCSRKEEKIPDDILKKEIMVPLLADIHIAEAAAVINSSAYESSKKDIKSAYHSVFSKYSITENDFRRSMDYYTMHPELLDKIYEEVITELSKKQADLQGKKQ